MNIINWLTNTIKVKIYLDEKYVKTVCVSKRKIENLKIRYADNEKLETIRLVKVEIIDVVSKYLGNIDNLDIDYTQYITDCEKPLENCSLYFLSYKGENYF